MQKVTFLIAKWKFLSAKSNLAIAKWNFNIIDHQNMYVF